MLLTSTGFLDVTFMLVAKWFSRNFVKRLLYLIPVIVNVLSGTDCSR